MVMKELIIDLSITKLAMPKIAAGLDRLDWDAVLSIICEVFEDTDVEILICEL
jgi:O-acetyl-ADP-ribose deacetylase (regulator of RNase III)